MTPQSIEVRTISTRDEFVEHGALLQAVWGTPEPLVNVELLTAMVHSGGYAAAAFHDNVMVGASVGFLADHHGALALHSHVTGVVDSLRHIGVGRAIKLHQRTWAGERHLDWITWTFDPLVRRNAWFNIAILGADVDAYLPSFYGEMTDAINLGDDSDRLLMAWDVTASMPIDPRDGAGIDSGIDGEAPMLIATPSDVVELRRRDPAAVAAWRCETRAALTAALGARRQVVGFTRDGAYVIGSPS